MLHHGGMAAIFVEGTEAGGHSGPVGQGGVENLHKHLPHILPDPLVEEGDQEFAPLLGRDRHLHDLAGLVAVEGRRQTPVGEQSLHYRGELQVFAPYLLEKAVKLQRMVGVVVVDHGHGVPLHPVFLQQLYPLHHTQEGALSGGGAAVFVVYLLRTVDRDPHQPMVVAQEAAPFVGEHSAVGLQRVVYMMSLRILLLQLHGLFKEVERAQRGLSAMPHKHHPLGGGGADILADIALEGGVAHPGAVFAVVERLLFQIVAIFTMEIALRAGGFGHDIHRRLKGARHPYLFHQSMMIIFNK